MDIEAVTSLRPWIVDLSKVQTDKLLQTNNCRNFETVKHRDEQRASARGG